MRDLKVGMLFQIDPKFQDLIGSIGNESVRKVAEAYQANISRTETMMNMIYNIAAWSSHIQKFGMLANLSTYKAISPSVEQEKIEDLKVQCQRVFSELVEEHFRYARENSIESANTFLRLAHDRIVTLSEIWPEGMIRGFESVLSTVTTNTWTSFEVLVTDLWVCAINSRPMSLGITAINNSFKREDGDKEPNRDSRNPLTMDILVKYEFDVRDRIGSLLWREQGYNFNSLKKISKAYQLAFAQTNSSGTSSGCPKEVKGWFCGEDYKRLGVLEALRHCLVHRAGYADKPFLDRVKGNHEVLSEVSENQLIPLDGELVHSLAMSSFSCGRTLIKGIDKWLTDHPK